MTYWSWEVGGLALAGSMLLHWVTTGRLMAVSGRFTALVNRVRLGPSDPSLDLSEEELIAALRAATAEQFGAQALESAGSGEPAESQAPPSRSERPAAPQALPDHVLFLVALVAGGLLSSVLAGRWNFVPALASTGFARITNGSPVLGAALLVVGGSFVGFGTRMAGGCTSGHGMCGVSRFQSGSLLATAAFFGTGVATAFALGWLG
jgi:hypothetical protein